METKARVLKLLSADFLAAYVVTMRPYLLFVSGITGIAGMSLVPSVSTPHALMILFATFLSYGFGQALTDCFQIDTDTLSSPYRPLTQGIVTRREVLAVSVAGLLLCVTVLTILNPWNCLLGLVAGAGLATYTPFKRKWWGGPWYNAWIVALLSGMAYLAAAAPHKHGSPAALPSTLCAVFLGYANFVLAGYFKDISADTRSNYNTLPVAFGRATAACVSTTLSLLSILALLFARSNVAPDRGFTPGAIISWMFLIAAIAVATTAQILLHRVRADEESHKPIALVVHAYILGLSAVASAAQPTWAPALILFYVAFILVLNMRPCRSQI